MSIPILTADEEKSLGLYKTLLDSIITATLSDLSDFKKADARYKAIKRMFGEWETEEKKEISSSRASALLKYIRCFDPRPISFTCKLHAYETHNFMVTYILKKAYELCPRSNADLKKAIALEYANNILKIRSVNILPPEFLKDSILMSSLLEKAITPEYASQRNSVEKIIAETFERDVETFSERIRRSQMTPQEKFELMINYAHDKKGGLAEIMDEIRDHPLVRDVLRLIHTEEKKLDDACLDSIINALTAPANQIENELTRKLFIELINKNGDLKAQVKDRIIATGRAQSIIEGTHLLSDWMKTPRIFGSVMFRSPMGETDSYRELVAAAAKPSARRSPRS